MSSPEIADTEVTLPESSTQPESSDLDTPTKPELSDLDTPSKLESSDLDTPSKPESTDPEIITQEESREPESPTQPESKVQPDETESPAVETEEYPEEPLKPSSELPEIPISAGRCSTQTPTGPRRQFQNPTWFARDPSKAYYEKFSLIWAPLSMALLLGGLLATPLYKYCNRDSLLAITVVGCLPGVLIPLFFPCEADRQRPFTQRFWVKGTVWIAIFGFYGNYFWTHYFYRILGARYLFDSYLLNDVPLVTFTCTFFYFTFYFNFINLFLRRIAYYTCDFPPFGRSLIWWISIASFSYGTAVFEAVSVKHFPLYTFTDWDTFLLVGSVVYGLYFIVGFPMFFSLDESPSESLVVPYDDDKHDSYIDVVDFQTHELSDVVVNALASTAMVTLLLDLWRLFLGSIYNLGDISNVKLPFIYQQTEVTPPVMPSVATPSPEIVYVENPVTVDACVGIAKTWAQERMQSVTSLITRQI